MLSDPDPGGGGDLCLDGKVSLEIVQRLEDVPGDFDCLQAGHGLFPY